MPGSSQVWKQFYLGDRTYVTETWSVVNWFTTCWYLLKVRFLKAILP